MFVSWPPASPESTEQEVFERLGALCRTPGYIHALAYLAIRDAVTIFEDTLRAEDFIGSASASTLIAKELMTLVGLMMGGSMDVRLPTAGVVSKRVAETDALLEELHNSMYWEGAEDGPEARRRSDVDGHRSGKSFREPIYYGADAAYMSQYRDLAPLKYRADRDWFLRNRGFEPALGPAVVRGVGSIICEKVTRVADQFRSGTPVEGWTPLTAFTFSLQEVRTRIGIDEDSVRALLAAFVAPPEETNRQFTAVDEFNVAYAYPLIALGDEKFALLQPCALAEALYESPYYWMCQDSVYSDTASKHRGEFTESLCADRLGSVFSERNVHRNVIIVGSDGQSAGEIDVLVEFGNRAVVVEAKSKRLTHAARQGNYAELRNDIRKAVEVAVAQARRNASLLLEGRLRLRTNEGLPIVLKERLRTVFPIAALCGAFPGLSVLCKEFLGPQPSECNVARAFVTDVFQIDILAEFLSSPLRFLNYLEYRAQCGERLFVDHERTALAWHLKHNLQMPPDIVLVGNELCAELDVAMAARRDGVSGQRTPPGILTRFEGTRFARMLTEIERSGKPSWIGLGLVLLQLSRSTVNQFNEMVDEVLLRIALDGRRHSATVCEAVGRPGVTVHCSNRPAQIAVAELVEHCWKGKYRQRSDSWYGALLGPDGSLRHVTELNDRWARDPGAERGLGPVSGERAFGRKIGRNDRCPCGSGRKYKRCCLR